ncbi:ABC transporter permease [Micromonospora sp. DT228]|uniref:ABC transporter permease n=1 Tax=Micromonospora sp. DT228 TaxID=3393443 RepID=UPI003CEF30F1
MVGLFALIVLFALAFLVPLIDPWDQPTRDFTAFLESPSARHWYGTSQTGADLFAQVLRGMQKSLVIGLFAAVVATGLAASVGAAAGYFGGWTDRLLMWGVDLLLVLPAFLVLALLSPSLRDRGWLLFALLLALFQWMVTGRTVRNTTRSLREREYVRAARYLGVPSYRIILRHIVPAMAPLLIADATVNLGSAIVGEAALSYVGFGIQPPETSLGTLIADGSSSFLTTPWLFLFPALTLVAIVLSATLVGDGLRDALDPQSTP